MEINKIDGKKITPTSIEANLPLSCVQNVTKQMTTHLKKYDIVTIEDFFFSAKTEEDLQNILSEIKEQKGKVARDIQNLWLLLQKIKNKGIPKQIEIIEANLKKENIRFDTCKKVIGGIITFLHTIKKHHQIAVVKELQLNEKITRHLLKIAA